MDPNINQSANQPTSGPVGNGQTISRFGQNDVKPVQMPAKKSSNKTSLIACSIIGVAVIAAVVVAAVMLNGKSKVPEINFEEDNKLSMYSERASKIDPANYKLDEKDNDEAEEKAEQLLDAIEMDTDQLLSYFKDKIQAELDKNDTDAALKLLWKEQDLLQERGMNSLVQKVLLEMDTSKLVNFQKIYLYRAIVTASVMVGDEETLNKYTALVNELDYPDQYVYPSNGEAGSLLEDEE